jgi:hypothetical protein
MSSGGTSVEYISLLLQSIPDVSTAGFTASFVH